MFRSSARRVLHWAQRATAVPGAMYAFSVTAGLMLALMVSPDAIAQSRSGSGFAGMSSGTPSGATAGASSGASPGLSAGAFTGIGRAATPAEIKAWDIDVRPDFKGLPPGRGTVAKGQDVWEAKCASCHGVFGESNQVFPPIVGGTTKKDMQTGRVASLANDSEAQRTMMMKLSSVSTLWDYINRAMPWNAPKTLTVEEVYAVTGFILNLADLVPDDFALTHENIASVQARLPNRNGKTREHAMWLPQVKGAAVGKGRPDVQATACMRNCTDGVKVASFIPEHARDAHGNLAEQSRVVGATRGLEILPRAAGTANTAASNAATTVASAAGVAATAPSEFAAIKGLANKGACLACHATDRKLVGPGFNEVLARYKADPRAEAMLAGKIKSGGQGVWGAVPMPPSPAINDSEAALLAKWILRGTPE